MGQPENRFENFYRHCGGIWSDQADCRCNDRCPVCNKEIEPYESIKLNDNHDEKTQISYSGNIPGYGPEEYQSTSQLLGRIQSITEDNVVDVIKLVSSHFNSKNYVTPLDDMYVLEKLDAVATFLTKKKENAMNQNNDKRPPQSSTTGVFVKSKDLKNLIVRAIDAIETPADLDSAAKKHLVEDLRVVEENFNQVIGHQQVPVTVLLNQLLAKMNQFEGMLGEVKELIEKPQDKAPPTEEDHPDLGTWKMPHPNIPNHMVGSGNSYLGQPFYITNYPRDPISNQLGYPMSLIPDARQFDGIIMLHVENAAIKSHLDTFEAVFKATFPEAKWWFIVHNKSAKNISSESIREEELLAQNALRGTQVFHLLIVPDSRLPTSRVMCDVNQAILAYGQQAMKLVLSDVLRRPEALLSILNAPIFRFMQANRLLKY